MNSSCLKEAMMEAEKRINSSSSSCAYFIRGQDNSTLFKGVKQAISLGYLREFEYDSGGDCVVDKILEPGKKYLSSLNV